MNKGLTTYTKILWIPLGISFVLGIAAVPRLVAADYVLPAEARNISLPEFEIEPEGEIDLSGFPSPRSTAYSIGSSNQPRPREVIIDPRNVNEGETQILAIRYQDDIGVQAVTATCTIQEESVDINLDLLRGTPQDGWWIGSWEVRNYPPDVGYYRIGFYALDIVGDNSSIGLLLTIPDHSFVNYVLSPRRGTGAEIDSVVSVQFWDAMDASTINTNSFTLSKDGVTVPGVVTYDSIISNFSSYGPITYHGATFTPNTNLDSASTYTATLTSDITDAAGNPLVPAYSWDIATLTTFSISPSYMLFGEVMVGSTSSPRTMTITNDGTANMTIGSLYLPDGDTASFLIWSDDASGKTLSAGTSATFQVVFSPTSIGLKRTWLRIPFDSSNTGILLTGTGTPIPPPALTTNIASSITSSTVTLNGSLDSIGGYDSVNVSFEWGTNSGALDQETTPRAMISIGTFSDNISGLLSNTTYYFRSKAVANLTVYGDELSFTTEASPPTDVSLVAGWNIFALAEDPSPAFTASTLAADINSQGGNVTQVFHWNASASTWDFYLVDIQHGDDFAIVMGQGYLLKNETASTWVYEGTPLPASSAEVSVVDGWNLIGLPIQPAASYTASTLAAEINDQGGNVTQVFWWDARAGSWVIYLVGSGYGDDFAIELGEGYLLKSEAESMWTIQGN